jgi:hypothetical protein
MSYESETPLSKVYEKAGKKSEVRGLRLCRSTVPGRADSRSKLVDRDVNAALNHPEGGNLPGSTRVLRAWKPCCLWETVDAADTGALTSQS